MVATVELGGLDDPDAVEDLLAARLSASGYFVEQNVVEREDQLFELDVVGRRVSEPRVETVLAEAKSGNWGMPDVFKLLGWKVFLDADSCVFGYSTSVKKNIDDLQAKFSRFDLRLENLEQLATTESSHDLEVWRYSKLAERTLRKIIAQRAKSGDLAGAAACKEYDDLITDRLFFLSDPLARVELLYGAYSANPNLAKRVAHELDGGGFADHPPAKAISFQQAMRRGHPKLVQAAFYLEHRARLAIIQAGSEVARLHNAGSIQLEDALEGTPPSFQNAVRWLADCEGYEAFPVFWQHLLFGWGGFLLRNSRNEELRNISIGAGLEESCAANALDAYDKFFPNPNSWWYSVADEVDAFKLIPRCIAGIGAHRRKLLYGEGCFKSPNSSGTALVAWNNHAVSLLG